jgi:serine/threonine protein kinase
MESEEVKVNSIRELEFPNNEKKYLGEGASGCVKLVRHKRLDRFFALKQISLEKQTNSRMSQEKKVFYALTQLELIKREIKLHKQLIHPNIIRLYDYFKVKANIFLLMEWAQKGNLFNILKTETKLEESVAARYFWQTCKGIEYLHSKQVIHRDLKVFKA